MTPLSFEWQWIVDYAVFFGLLYLALSIVGCGVIYTFIKSWVDLKKSEEAKLPPVIEKRSRYKDY